ncbi:MAG TPA: Ppx/GppA phosphatase family protein, partial [Trueperaceae bacterium]|nr:Ppx/GppA phosphatase family protein [Trueperaceae bacterium]
MFRRRGGGEAAAAGVKTIAILDVGSNTTKLCVYAVRPGAWWRQLDELRAVVRLNSGSGESGALTASAMERGLAVLERFADYLASVGVDELRATATSAVRDASNGAEFLAEAKRRAGLEIETLDGEEEARLGALAVANSFALDDVVVLDVGGGSAQLSLIRGRRVVEARSWPLGAVATTEQFLRSDPPTKPELALLRRHVKRSIAGWFKDTGAAGLPLVGMGGTIRNLGNYAIQLAGAPTDFLHGYAVEKSKLSKVVSKVVKATVAERGQVAALSSDRADIIAAGAVVVHEVVKASGVDSLVISGQGLREGLLYEFLLPDREPALVDDVRRFAIDNLRGRSGFSWPRAKDPAHVEALALSIYDALPTLGDRSSDRDLLGAAARLHDVGKVVDYRDQHKHGLGLIMSEPIPGYSRREQALIALLVRYQRAGKPSANGLAAMLRPEDGPVLERLAGILRLAVAF